jgi:BirA family biotin operon repressor/biotin-[acetyl-CoA-carboxylase] ligase
MTLPPDLEDVPARVRALGLALGHPLVFHAETASTNDLAKEAGKSGAPHGTTFVADAQTHGRGRQGRAWVAAPGEALLVSVLFRTECPLARLPQLSLAVGLAVRDAVAEALGDDTRALVKWPNDVWARGPGGEPLRKVAGVLVESTLLGGHVESLVVGVGINVATREFPEELRDRATSLALLGAPHVTRGDVLVALVRGLAHDVPRAAAHGLGPLHERLARACALTGSWLETGDVAGRCEGIDRDGRLLVRGGDGTLARLVSGEVHVGALPR